MTDEATEDGNTETERLRNAYREAVGSVMAARRLYDQACARGSVIAESCRDDVYVASVKLIADLGTDVLNDRTEQGTRALVVPHGLKEPVDLFVRKDRIQHGTQIAPVSVLSAEPANAFVDGVGQSSSVRGDQKHDDDLRRLMARA